jgi:hypothetical protein
MKTPHFTITKISWLKMLLKEIIAVYSENYTTTPPITKYSVAD